MTLIARRLRGILGTALVWGGTWLLVGIGFGIYRLLTLRPEYPSPQLWLRIISIIAGIWAVWGVVSGAAFAIVLLIAERRRAVADLSMLRVALWGALGANVLPVIYFVIVLTHPTTDIGLLGPFAIVALVCALLGAGAATRTLGLARRSERVAA